MKALVSKELRENVKLAVLGLIIYALLLVVQYRDYVASSAAMYHPLAGENLLWSTVWFSSIFGAVLGWLQLHNERRPDLWAFLLHRPMTRTEIFLAKTLAGLVLYAVVVGLPLLCFIIWALWPGHVAAPFEPAMLLPVAAYILAAIGCYFAGQLTGLRQARWYASRALGLGLALSAGLLMQFQAVWWQGFLMILLGTAILIAAVWGGFQSQGHYKGQPAFGKAALTIALLGGTTLVAVTAALLLSNLFPGNGNAMSWSRYAMTADGAIVKLTQGPGRRSSIVDLEGKPLMDAKTGRRIELADFNWDAAKSFAIAMGVNELGHYRMWTQPPAFRAVRWHATPDTLWYYWPRYGRLVGYDITTRRCIGSLGPQGFARELSGGGDRFSNLTETSGTRTLTTATTLYLLDLDKRTTKPLFTTTSDDPILTSTELTPSNYDWEYTAVVTKRFVYLLTPDGQPVWKVPYEPKALGYRRTAIYFLQPSGHFALWMAPSYEEEKQSNWSLPTHVVWLKRDQGVVRTADLAALPRPTLKPNAEETLACAVAPPAVWPALPWLRGVTQFMMPPRELLLLDWGGAVLVCLPIGWWLGRRHRFSLAAQLGWAVFHVLFGVPGLLAFLSVQEWPARVPCPNCQLPRMVDRPQCEHCGAAFAPPEQTGTEVFAPLQASS
jgi:hypothetical protein